MVLIGVLGPLEVRTDDGSPVRVAEAKVRGLLAALLAYGGGPVSADRLIEDLWGRPTPLGTLQARVSQLRRALGGPGTILLEPAGYRLAGFDCDAERFRALVARRSPDPVVRAAELEEALGLWRGAAYADFTGFGFARAEADRLSDLRLSALEEQAEVRLALGEPVELGDLVARHPLRERLVAAHMTALYRGGRQGEALAAYQGLRERLAEELGVDPAPETAALYEALLRQEPGLGPPAAPPTNLPAPVTSLIGREVELAGVRAELGGSRLVTLTGPGGVGKTRLALAAAAEVARGSGSGGAGDGVWLVELAGAVDPAEAVAAVLGVRDDATVPLPDRLAGVVAGKRVLLVLDNCEHVVGAVAALVPGLLRAAPGLRVLATSQEPLGVTGERVRVVPPLPEPDAVRLFTARANVEPSETVATICRRLDGIPLALELAATRVRALGVEELADRLDDRFRLLSAGMRDAPARQRTLRAMIDWSWELLPDEERVVLRRLAVHAGGCTLEAAEEICAEPGLDVLDLLARLVDRSLVVRVPSGDGSQRYRLLESVAAYCQERLAEAGERGLAEERHARYYTALAERAEVKGPRQREWLARLDAESGNLRLALTGPEPLRLVNALSWYWILRGRLREARRALRGALGVQTGGEAVGASAVGGEAARAAGMGGEAARASVWLAAVELLIGGPGTPVRRDELDPAGAALADWLLSHVRWAYGDRRAHEAAADRALAAFEALGDRWGVAAALCLRAKLAVGRGDLTAMERDGERGLALFRELGDGWGQIEAMDVLDRVAEVRGDYARCARLREEGLRLAEELGFEVSFKLAALGRIALLGGDYELADDYHERARALAVEQSSMPAEENALLGLAMSARRRGRYEEAESYLLPVLDWLRQVRGTPGIAFIMAELGFAAEQRGDVETALARHREGYAAARASGDPRAVALALEGLAGALSLCGGEWPVEAGRLLGAATALRRSVGAPLPPGERLDVERASARLRAALGEERFERALTSGDDALGRALASGEDALGRALASGEDALGRALSSGEDALGRALAAGHEGLGGALAAGHEGLGGASAAGQGVLGWAPVSGKRELGDHLPGALIGRSRVEPAAQRLHPLGHPDQPEPAAEPRHPRI
ncbi:BTAD domain-containing putative transcriptional regulator [Nonomuraea sp. PA05]|uniref:BTAD domain-containing putative transcriptional regulator n=1 Tax=Nonomuraea sp. PA05 TaxID=2604466 RepID=UPI00292A4584|nr:BTAD domain-containing putative transcriptional regulator [Nonomuraea sp. PA05]